MATVNLPLNSSYVSAGSFLTATGGPYTASDALTITVQDTDEAAVRSDLGYLIVGGSGSTVPAPFARTMIGIDMSVGTKQALFTCPAGKSAVVTLFVVRNASGTVDPATSYGFGWDAGASDVVATGAFGPSVAAAATYIKPGVDDAHGGFESAVGVAGGVLGLLATVVEASPLTVDVDVFGYTF